MCFLTGCLAKPPLGANNTAHSHNFRNTLPGYAMVDRIPQKKRAQQAPVIVSADPDWPENQRF
jgi:hypothetical protein